jgi:hypothetical protein
MAAFGSTLIIVTGSVNELATLRSKLSATASHG